MPHRGERGSLQASPGTWIAGKTAGSTAPSLDVPCAAGLPVARGGQTVPSQAPLYFDPGSPASDRTEGKKKGRPKAENQALRDIPVSSLRAGWGSCWGLPVRPLPCLCLPSTCPARSPQPTRWATLCLGIRGMAWGPVDHVRGPSGAPSLLRVAWILLRSQGQGLLQCVCPAGLGRVLSLGLGSAKAGWLRVSSLAFPMPALSDDPVERRIQGALTGEVSQLRVLAGVPQHLRAQVPLPAVPRGKGCGLGKRRPEPTLPSCWPGCVCTEAWAAHATPALST